MDLLQKVVGTPVPEDIIVDVCSLPLLVGDDGL